MNPEPYHFIFRNDKEAFIEELIEFREVINDLPETWSTFKPARRFDRSVYLQFHSRPELVRFAGSWRCPDWFTGRGNNTVSRLVNPSAHDASRYTIAGVRCECGNIVHHHPFMSNFQIEQHHTEDCEWEQKMEAGRIVQDIRLRRIVQGAHFNQSQREIEDCLGMDRSRIPRLLQKNGLDWVELKEIGRMRMAKTIRMLSEMGYSQREIGEAFGMGSSTVGEYFRGEILRDSPTPVSV